MSSDSCKSHNHRDPFWFLSLVHKVSIQVSISRLKIWESQFLSPYQDSGFKNIDSSLNFNKKNSKHWGRQKLQHYLFQSRHSKLNKFYINMIWGEKEFTPKSVSFMSIYVEIFITYLIVFRFLLLRFWNKTLLQNMSLKCAEYPCDY